MFQLEELREKKLNIDLEDSLDEKRDRSTNNKNPNIPRKFEQKSHERKVNLNPIETEAANYIDGVIRFDFTLLNHILTFRKKIFRAAERQRPR